MQRTLQFFAILIIYIKSISAQARQANYPNQFYIALLLKTQYNNELFDAYRPAISTTISHRLK